MNDVYVGVAIAVVGAIVLALLQLVWKWVRERVQYATPERRRTDRLEARLDKMEPALSAILDNQKPLLEGIAAVLIAVRDGHVNGNITTAIATVNEAAEGFDHFLVSGAKPVGKEA